MKIFKDLTEQEEKESRQWARNNYSPLELIKGVWHPIVQNECSKINQEFSDSDSVDLNKKIFCLLNKE